MKISKMMTMAGVGVLAIGLLVLPMNADAGRFRGAQGGTGAGGGANFVDANGDGVCDYYGTGVGGGGANFVDADGNGVCDYYDTNAAGYTDANGNGINDYYEAGGAGFVDANGDGVCDLFGGGRRGGRG